MITGLIRMTHVNIPVDVSSTRPSVGVRQKEDRHRECGSWSRSTDERHVVEQVDASRVVSRPAPFPADSIFMLKKTVALSSDGTESSLRPACETTVAEQIPTVSANDKPSHDRSSPVLQKSISTSQTSTPPLSLSTVHP